MASTTDSRRFCPHCLHPLGLHPLGLHSLENLSQGRPPKCTACGYAWSQSMERIEPASESVCRGPHASSSPQAQSAADQFLDDRIDRLLLAADRQLARESHWR